MALAPDPGAKAFYEEHGYLILKNVWPADEAAKWRARLLRRQCTSNLSATFSRSFLHAHDGVVMKCNPGLGTGSIPAGALGGNSGTNAESLGITTTTDGAGRSSRSSGAVIYNDRWVDIDSENPVSVAGCLWFFT